MPTYKIITYDVWGNDEDGYEVNAAYYSGEEITIDEDAGDITIVTALQDAGWLWEEHTEDVEIDGDPAYSLYLNRINDSKPLLELRNEPA